MGKNYENIEEWIATLNEYLIHHDDIETLTIKPEISHIATLIWELYDFEWTFTILKSYYKLIWKSDNVANKLALTRTKRVKSYYDWDRPGANRKDVIYYRWLKKLKEHLEKLPPEERANFYNDAYFSTLSFEDVCLVSTMKKEMEINDDTTDIPYPLAKLIARKQSYKNPKTETNKWAFKNKEEIQERLIWNDFRFQKIAPLTMEKKRQVINIIQYKEESKEYENLKKDLETINNIIRRWWETNQYNESLFISEITKKLFIKRKNMVEKEIVDQNTLKTWPKKRGTFSIIEILQKVWDEIEWILTRKLK